MNHYTADTQHWILVAWLLAALHLELDSFHLHLRMMRVRVSGHQSPCLYKTVDGSSLRPLVRVANWLSALYRVTYCCLLCGHMLSS